MGLSREPPNFKRELLFPLCWSTYGPLTPFFLPRSSLWPALQYVTLRDYIVSLTMKIENLYNSYSSCSHAAK